MNLAFKKYSAKLVSNNTYACDMVVYVLEQLNVDMMNRKILSLSQPTCNNKFRLSNPQFLDSIDVMLYLFTRNIWKNIISI